MAAAPHPGPLPADAGRGRDYLPAALVNRSVCTKASAIDFPLPSLARGEGQGEGCCLGMVTASFRLSRVESDSPGFVWIFRHRPDRQAGSRAASSRRTPGSADGTERSGAAWSRRSPKLLPAPPVGWLARVESAGCSRPSPGDLGTWAGARAGPRPGRLGDGRGRPPVWLAALGWRRVSCWEGLYRETC